MRQWLSCMRGNLPAQPGQAYAWRSTVPRPFPRCTLPPTAPPPPPLLQQRAGALAPGAEDVHRSVDSHGVLDDSERVSVRGVHTDYHPHLPAAQRCLRAVVPAGALRARGRAHWQALPGRGEAADAGRSHTHPRAASPAGQPTAGPCSGWPSPCLPLPPQVLFYVFDTLPILLVFACYTLAHPGWLLPPDGPPPKAAAVAAADVEAAGESAAQLQQEGGEGSRKGSGALKESVQDA